MLQLWHYSNIKLSADKLIKMFDGKFDSERSVYWWQHKTNRPVELMS